MSLPDTPRTFAEPWHAQVLGLAQLLVDAGHVTPADWAQTLGAELTRATRDGKPDTEDTYFSAVLAALERVSAEANITPQDLESRVEAWRHAYLDTPHGQPVRLKDGTDR